MKTMQTAPTIAATLSDGPLKGRTITTDVIEGRPPKIIDVQGDDGSMCRYCLAKLIQSGSSAVYTFVYRV